MPQTLRALCALCVLCVKSLCFLLASKNLSPQSAHRTQRKTADPRKPATCNLSPTTCISKIIAKYRTRKHVTTRTHASMQATPTFFVMIRLLFNLRTDDPIGSTREPQGPFLERLPLRACRACARMDYAPGRTIPARIPRRAPEAQFPRSLQDSRAGSRGFAAALPHPGRGRGHRFLRYPDTGWRDGAAVRTYRQGPCHRID